MAADFDVLVVGCGVIGASVAYALRDHNREVTIIEKAHRAATATTSRNSGVIHAGLYYPPGSNKADLCRLGRDMIYAFAREHKVAHEKNGKYVVANGPDEETYLKWLLVNAAPTPLYAVDRWPVGIRATAAVFSPESGVVDQHALVDALLLASAATCLFDIEVTAIEGDEDRAWVTTNGERVSANHVINCAGLQATDFTPDHHHDYAKGSYFSIRHPALKELDSLVYPAISKKSLSLGVHLLRTTNHEWYLGPDFEWVEKIDYAVDESRAQAFADAAERYLPGLTAADLSPAYAGIRPKLSRTENRDFTFVSEGPDKQIIHCLGIDSPGLTASMAIGELVSKWIVAN